MSDVPPVSRARNFRSGDFVLLNRDDYQGYSPYVLFPSGSHQFYFHAIITGKYGAEPEEKMFLGFSFGGVVVGSSPFNRGE
jgi:hypothetical protein